MASTGEVKPDSEAAKWFVLAMVGTALYVAAAFTFVILADVEPTSDAVFVEEAAPADGHAAEPGAEPGKAVEAGHGQ